MHVPWRRSCVVAESVAGGRLPSSRRRCCQQVRVKLARASMFHPDNARAALELVHVRGMPSDLRPSDRLNILNTMVRHSLQLLALRWCHHMSRISSTDETSAVNGLETVAHTHARSALSWAVYAAFGWMQVSLTATQQLCAAGALVSLLHREGAISAPWEEDAGPGSKHLLAINSIIEVLHPYCE
jgi:hypothetical protein